MTIVTETIEPVRSDVRKVQFRRVSYEMAISQQKPELVGTNQERLNDNAAIHLGGRGAGESSDINRV